MGHLSQGWSPTTRGWRKQGKTNRWHFFVGFRFSKSWPGNSFWAYPSSKLFGYKGIDRYSSLKVWYNFFAINNYKILMLYDVFFMLRDCWMLRAKRLQIWSRAKLRRISERRLTSKMILLRAKKNKFVKKMNGVKKSSDLEYSFEKTCSSPVLESY